MAKIIAIANQKGGVGKTTTAVNLSACLAQAGKRVLLIDLDPQGNATSGLGVHKSGLNGTLYNVLTGELRARAALHPIENTPGLTLLPANEQLVGAEVELVAAERREFRLKEALAEVSGDYDHIYIDCPPSLSLLTVNGLVAADGVLITLQCEYYALEGLSKLLQTVKLVRDGLNHNLRLEGVLLTMFQHTRLSNQVISDVRQHLGDKVYETVIPRNVTLSEAPSYGLPVAVYDPRSAGARAYQSLAQEVIAHG